MDESTTKAVKDLQSTDKNIRYEAFIQLMETTKSEVDWAYEVWDDLLEDLSHQDNHRRAIAAQLLCQLAKSDPENRMLQDFPRLMEVTRDKRFVTARHCLQSLWKVGTAGANQKDMVIAGLSHRFENCRDEKNYTLIRFDIIQGLHHLYEEVPDETIKQQAIDLIETVEEDKYRKKYAAVWKL
ncbi:hypothetical protein [Sediminibacillus albus]|uniref:HEAT repeat-containing protein n=1 Tax=Sediminibacillus albus TaxID=407036 RepID=A0A1G8WZ68_9BACI|nr:hypothetical protein [Sediminibacillus albus]SDJ83366.1 hypothetical protein SAMN05216243_1063 [Sediminibacillus albus]